MSLDLNSFVVADPSKCIGCRACEIACAAGHRENNNGKTIGTMNRVVTPGLFMVKDEGMVMPIQCRHCEDAPCISACPVDAILKNGESVIINENACIGCKTCTLVCPVGAVELLPRVESNIITGQIETKVKLAAYKCDLCSENGKEPVCVRECPKDALKLVRSKEKI